MNTGNKKMDDRSLKELQGVHPRLTDAIISFARDPLCDWKFIITDGLRTDQEQALLVVQGASHTLHSKHLSGRAIDICILLNGKARWEFELYKRFARTFLAYAFNNFNLDLTWGGDWKKLKDGPHFEMKDETP